MLAGCPTGNGLSMPVLPYREDHPQIGEGVFIAPDAWVTGKTTIGKNSSLFFGAVVRGDINPVRVGTGTNLQEHALLHTSTGLGPCIVGDYVTVGHRAILHGCTVGNRCIIGMGATILDGAEIGDDCIIGANSLITMNTKIPSGSMVFGSPGKVVRPLTDDERLQIEENATHYIAVAHTYAAWFHTCS